MAKKIAFIALAFLIVISGAAFAKTALDPSSVGLGARVLGMGRAYAALEGEPDSVFLNPAALSAIPNWGLTSMYTSLLGEVNYISLGGVRPLGKGQGVGVGMLSASVGGIQSAVRDPITGRITFEAGLLSYYNNIYYISYGREVLDNLAAGVSLKLFSQGFSSGDSGSGYDADAGLLFRPRDDLSIGFVQRNFLPSSAGALIKWSDGTEEGFATSSRLGVNYQRGPFALNADYTIYPTQPSEPGELNLGAEWWLNPMAALRLGSDQDGTETNLTAGFSVLARGFKFDYAYHMYGDEPSHMFSISYGVFREEGPRRPEAELVQVLSPDDKSIVFEETVAVQGRVLPAVKRLRLDGTQPPLTNGAFSSVYPLSLGRNIIELTPYDGRGRELKGVKLRVVRLQGFSDVPEGYWVRVPISVMAMLKLVGGYPDGTFRPEGNITRAEICTILMKIRGATEEGAGTGFKDVPAKHWATKYIAQAVAEGIVKGYPDKTFRPNGLITRAEGVAIISRFSALPDPKVLESPYSDVPGRHWAARDIISAREAGLLEYIGDFFEPKRKLTRAEVVEMLSRTDALAPKIKEAVSFEEASGQ